MTHHHLSLKMFIAVLTLCAGSSVNADWSQVGRTVEATVSYDKQTLRKTGSMARIWTLTNFAATEVIEGKSHRSAKSQYEYDCVEERYRLLATIFYELPSGSGKVTASVATPEQWYPVGPKTMAERLWKVACER